ncbi:hypothetical protein O181_087646 [Austropuccinia psidii MF-1]|uniref:Uncharacterized protein n=1 Tax=Austropuccinia psidii MF-1 TaxID=1389203 RepID=A0A9Q3IQ15_9BASI|nr:hypothetical protein [Austropuccinia psidii MF-1]
MRPLQRLCKRLLIKSAVSNCSSSCSSALLASAKHSVNEVLNHVSCPSLSPSLFLNKAAKQGHIYCNQKKAKIEGKTKRAKKVKGTLKNKAKESGDGWRSDEEDCAAKRKHWEEMNSKSQDLDKPESPEKEAGRLEQEQHQHANERDEFVEGLRQKFVIKLKKIVDNKPSKLTPDQIRLGNLHNDEQACKTDEAHKRT